MSNLLGKLTRLGYQDSPLLGNFARPVSYVAHQAFVYIDGTVVFRHPHDDLRDDSLALQESGHCGIGLNFVERKLIQSCQCLAKTNALCGQQRRAWITRRLPNLRRLFQRQLNVLQYPKDTFEQRNLLLICLTPQKSTLSPKNVDRYTYPGNRTDRLNPGGVGLLNGSRGGIHA